MVKVDMLRSMSHQNPLSHRILAVLTALVFLIGPASALDLPEGASGLAQKPLVKAKKHMIVAAHPLAAEAGLEMLRQGGAAIDAGIATQAVLTLVEPQSSGIGGGAFVLYWDAAQETLTSYDGRETAPAGATPDLFLDAAGKPLPRPIAMHSGRSVGVPGVLAMLRVRSEEINDRVEPVLAGSVARSRYYATNVVVAILAPSLFVLLAGFIVAVQVAGADLGLGFGQVLGQAAAVIPAVWTIVALAVAVVGVRPQIVLAAWAGVVISFVLTLLGPTFGLADWVLGISPMWHVPITALPDPDYSGLLWISLFTAGFLVVGFVGFRRRDLAR